MTPTPYTVYYAIDSLCSYMLRYTLAIRGPSKDGREISFEGKVVDIHYERTQLSEFFLLNVNPKGQVPAITSPALEKPMADSLDITNHFATMFPNLKPAGYEVQIDEMLLKIHNLPYGVLSFGGHRAQPILKGTMQAMKDKLARDDISPAYRKALEAKLAPVANLDFDTVFGLEAGKQAERVLEEFLKHVDQRLPSSEGWLFDLPRPSAADAHLVALLARMHDVGRGALIKGNIRLYADRAKGSHEWQSVMGTYTTTMCEG
ncbi:hypothetical protein M409DRAFT_25760 [Zasmidium cellare ATCC 36951]|uniref:GST N-terminal domain-containing protein n=1 Tax=Zasmidium cellare ATCC 36951 TaxID=1080233 RepID=A0A6A6CF00_ZASCE|nr:uncharacterized protein M409DRAFT_25760 [Zasmidium cellare ATCC 36951]KAF2163986.1 hypothetical protein M409DRAFT_25760 [Zasmidium cellare ATCC 36951]